MSSPAAAATCCTAPGRLRAAAGYLGAFAVNAVSRRALGGWLERVVFSDARDALPFPLDDYRSQRAVLTPHNLTRAVLASCSIPFVLDPVQDPPGAPPGTYWDGGLTDYHLHLDYAALGDGLVLYPHFHHRVVPGWLDKPWQRRHRATARPGQRGRAGAACRLAAHAAARQAARPQRLQDLRRRRSRPPARLAPSPSPRASAWPTSSPKWSRRRGRSRRSRWPDASAWARIRARFNQQGRERHPGYDTADYDLLLPRPRPRRNRLRCRSTFPLNKARPLPALCSFLEINNMLNDHAARRLAARVSRPRDGGRGGGFHRRRPGQGGARRPRRRQARRHEPRHRARRATGHRHRQGRRRPGDHPPLARRTCWPMR